MSAPKKIWVDEGMIAWAQYSKGDTPYIRADLVHPLAELLRLLYIMNFSQADPMLEDIKAALDQLEGCDD